MSGQALEASGSRPTEGALDAAVGAAIAAARRAFPTLGVEDARLAAALRARVEGEEDPLAALQAMIAEEVVLADACAAGDAGALALLEARYMPDVRATLGRVGLRDAGVDDAVQALREELLVSADGEPARIARYAGRGTLRGWLRAVASRTGLRVLRGAGREAQAPSPPAPGAMEGEVVAAGDLELEYLKKTYGATFKEAFLVAFDALPTPERLLLKQRFVHGMSAAEIGALRGVHASSASRWIAHARERLAAATRDEMMRRLGAGRAEVESLIRLIQSQLDITLSTASERDRAASSS